MTHEQNHQPHLAHLQTFDYPVAKLTPVKSHDCLKQLDNGFVVLIMLLRFATLAEGFLTVVAIVVHDANNPPFSNVL
ncbi:hypothetical protein J21TS7_55600 [Paenibacillus cineris]|uniref:Uncharacterized protein n=1 Tax=Paenibacillus cineris TaxID=237530 RepID=A0ABQ4LL92_9BACL|nr:hypothetical protein J21TS7_55600 [Paenibacillus cineris]